MVHTATLICYITGEEYESFASSAGKNGVVWYGNTKEVVLDLYKDIGIRVAAKKEVSAGYRCYIAFCLVNFHRITAPHDIAGVFTYGEYDAMRETFNTITSAYGLPDLDRYIVQRIDYCVNIVTPYAAEYVKLMQKGDKPYNLVIPYDTEVRGRHQKKGSVYYHSSAFDKRKKKTGAYTINFYDKYDEKRADGLTGEELEAFRNILRLEVQCHQPKVDALKKKFQLPNKRVSTMLSPDISKAVLREAVIRVAGTGDYFRKAEAFSLVDSFSCRETTKENIQKIMEEIGIQNGAVWGTRNKLVRDGQELTDEQFRNAMGKLRENGVNPVYIGDNKKVPGLPKKEGLPNIWKLYEEQHGG